MGGRTSGRRDAGTPAARPAAARAPRLAVYLRNAHCGHTSPQALRSTRPTSDYDLLLFLYKKLTRTYYYFRVSTIKGDGDDFG